VGVDSTLYVIIDEDVHLSVSLSVGSLIFIRQMALLYDDATVYYKM